MVDAGCHQEAPAAEAFYCRTFEDFDYIVVQARLAPPNSSRRLFAAIRSTVSNPSVKRS